MAGDWFDTNQPEAPQRAQQAPSQSPGPWASGYVPYYPDQDPNTPGTQNPDMPILPTAGNPNPPQQGGDPAAQFQQYLAQHPGNPQAAIDAWNAAGDPGGLKPAWIDATKTIGLANGTYLVQPGTGGNSGTDWQTVQRQEGGAGSNVPTFNYPTWDQTFNYDSFQAPTGLTEQNDPGFEARLQLGTDALQRSAAAKGSVLDTGTLKDLNSYAQNFASNEFGNVYNRAAQTYATNRNNAADIYNQKYSQYLGGFNNALTTFGTNFGVDQSLWNRALSQEQTGFAQQLSLADLGLSATGSTANAGNAYGNQATNLITGSGNAGAAGSIATGNAYANGLNNLANYGSQYLYNRPSSSYLPSNSTVPGYNYGIGH